MSVCTENPFAKRSLMNATPGQGCYILATHFSHLQAGRFGLCPKLQVCGIVNGNGERKRLGEVVNHIDWPDCEVPAGQNAMEIHERQLLFHGVP